VYPIFSLPSSTVFFFSPEDSPPPPQEASGFCRLASPFPLVVIFWARFLFPAVSLGFHYDIFWSRPPLPVLNSPSLLCLYGGLRRIGFNFSSPSPRREHSEGILRGQECSWLGEMELFFPLPEPFPRVSSLILFFLMAVTPVRFACFFFFFSRLAMFPLPPPKRPVGTCRGPGPLYLVVFSFFFPGFFLRFDSIPTCLPRGAGHAPTIVLSLPPSLSKQLSPSAGALTSLRDGILALMIPFFPCLTPAPPPPPSRLRSVLDPPYRTLVVLFFFFPYQEHAPRLPAAGKFLKVPFPFLKMAPEVFPPLFFLLLH